MSALSDLARIKDRNRNALQNAVIAYDHRPQEAAEILAAMQARIDNLESKLALCLVKLSEIGHESYADTIAEDVFETWQEIRHKAGR